MKTLNWTFKKFQDLSGDELYAIIHLRMAVFVVEQNCVFQDLDYKDQLCQHLMGWQDNKLVAYTRIVPAGISFPEPSIGRVITAGSVRGTGAGIQLMEKSIEVLEKVYGKTAIQIGAQVYLEKFYEKFGFKRSGEWYLEDDIEHIPMLRPIAAE